MRHGYKPRIGIPHKATNAQRWRSRKERRKIIRRSLAIAKRHAVEFSMGSPELKETLRPVVSIEFDDRGIIASAKVTWISPIGAVRRSIEKSALVDMATPGRYHTLIITRNPDGSQSSQWERAR